jgi:hypothetical protein
MQFVHPRNVRVLFAQNRIVYQIPLHFPQEQSLLTKAADYNKNQPQPRVDWPFDVSVSAGTLTLSLPTLQEFSTQETTCACHTTQTEMK